MLILFQFRRPPPKVPVKAICLASGLFFVGTILLVFGSLLFSGYFDVKVGTSITFTSITTYKDVPSEKWFDCCQLNGVASLVSSYLACEYSCPYLHSHVNFVLVRAAVFADYLLFYLQGADPGGLLGSQPPLWKMGKYVLLKI